MNIFRTVFAAGFRPFFASCALYAIVLMAPWIGVFTFGWTVAGLTWITTFALFALLVLPKPMRPRADGLSG